MKGFALGFQFNPHSAIEGEDFETLHELIADAPVLPADDAEDAAADIGAYVDDLLDARDLLARAYEFDEADVKNW